MELEQLSDVAQKLERRSFLLGERWVWLGLAAKRALEMELLERVMSKPELFPRERSLRLGFFSALWWYC